MRNIYCIFVIGCQPRYNTQLFIFSSITFGNNHLACQIGHRHCCYALKSGMWPTTKSAHVGYGKKCTIKFENLFFNETVMLGIHGKSRISRKNAVFTADARFRG